MRCRFMVQSVCLKPGALLVVVVGVVGDWAACPSLQLQSRSCIMAPIRSTLFLSGMSSLLCALVCARTHTQSPGHSFSWTIWLYRHMLQLCACFWVGIGKSNDLRSWLQGFPLIWTLRGQTQGNARATKQGQGPQYCYTQRGRERREGLSEDGIGSRSQNLLEERADVA